MKHTVEYVRNGAYAMVLLNGHVIIGFDYQENARELARRLRRALAGPQKRKRKVRR